MKFDGMIRNFKFGSDLFIAEPICNHPQYCDFSRSKNLIGRIEFWLFLRVNWQKRVESIPMEYD